MASMKTKKNKRANKKSPGQRIRIRTRSKPDAPPNKPIHKRASRTEQ